MLLWTDVLRWETVSFSVVQESVNAGEMSSRRFRAVVGLMKVPERELMGEVLLRDSAEPSLPVHVNIAKFVRLDDGQYVDTEDRGKTVKRRQLANAKERLRVSVRARACVCVRSCVCVRARFICSWHLCIAALFFLEIPGMRFPKAS